MYVVMSKLKDRISTDNKHMIKYIMRKIVLSLFALCCFSAVMAQQKTRSLSVELLGAQNIAGINYDSRFDGNSGLGYRVGIGYGDIFSSATSATAISAPTDSCSVLAYRRRSTLATSTDSTRQPSFHISA